MKKLIVLTVFMLAFSCLALGQAEKAASIQPTNNALATTVSDTKIPANSKIYINPMEDGFETYITAAIQKKKIPLLIVSNKEQADFEIKGSVEKQKAGWAKTIFISPLPSIDSTMQVVNVKTGVVVYSISSTKSNARRGKKGSAEHLAKNLAQKMQDEGQMSKD